MDWRIKACVQAALARLPGGTRLNDGLQQALGARRNAAAHLDSKFSDDWLVHAQVLRELGFDIRDRELVEIGTGWLPVFPLCYALAGARRCHTFDLNRHLRAQAVRPTLEHLEKHLPAIAQASGQTHAEVQRRWQHLLRADGDDAVLERAGIVYRAPANATATGLEDRSVALVFSNSVLEHVPPTVLGALMHEARRVLGPGGLALHSVNCGDHYAYFDSSITAIHYLRYSDEEWRRWNNDLLYQNRLRPVDFIDAARAAKLEVVLDRQQPQQRLLDRIDRLPIAPQFQRYPPDQLCCTSVTFAARVHIGDTLNRGMSGAFAKPT